MSKFTVGQAVTVEHRRRGAIIPGVVSEVLIETDPHGNPRPVIIGGQQQYAVDIGGANMRCGENQLAAL